MPDTTIRASTTLRNRLQALAEPGEKLEDTIERLADRFEAARTRNRMAAQERVAQAGANPDAVRWGDAEASRLAGLLADRQRHTP